jgi:hypothetical protein
MQRHDPLLSTFTEHLDESLGEVNAVEVQSAEFANAKTGTVEDLADRPVERGPFVLTPIVVEQVLQLLSHDDFWKSTVGTRCRDPRGRTFR